ncbi:MAG TPA: tetratricopeptide repeat protein [Polyangiaceae bacterium]|nr:tetratricopeptide repeat protein [Polyangiaceae bacterium]
MNARRALAVFGAFVSLACAPTRDAHFAAAEERANATARTGRHAEAAERWLEAARVADTTVDRDEAVYRAAASYERAGRTDQALVLYDRLAAGSGERAARASFDGARLVRESDATRGEAMLVAALRRHPNSGLAPRALREHLAGVEATAGMHAALDECTRLAADLGTSELDETLRYERARLLERAGSLGPARDAYIETATRHPYPEGALWDDALARAAELELRLERPLHAIALLERMLAEREPSTGLGSYERGRYAEARFRIAEIYRDRLADPRRARAEFRRVYEEHPTSLLRDDALWHEALVSLDDREPDAACAPLRLLVERLPDSRYAPCASRLCASAPAVRSRECSVPLPERGQASPSSRAPHSASSSSFSFSSSSSSSSSSSP